MSTIVTRSLSRKDRFDKVAVKVNEEDYEDKWGILEVDVTEYSWGSGVDAGDYGTVDLRPAQYTEDNDNILVDAVNLAASGGTTAVGKKYYFAVNDGVVGPAAFRQDDGSYDLLWLKYELPEDNTLEPVAVTLTFTTTFTEVTVSTNPTDDGTLTLNVNNVKVSDLGTITKPASDFTNKNGYVVAQINDLHTIVIDRPVDVAVPNPVTTDSVPLFRVFNSVTPRSFGSEQRLIQHGTTKVSGSKTYKEKALVFAINDGKVDGNATNIKATTNYVAFLKAMLDKVGNWQCDDHVTCVVDYACDFTEVV